MFWNDLAEFAGKYGLAATICVILLIIIIGGPVSLIIWYAKKRAEQAIKDTSEASVSALKAENDKHLASYNHSLSQKLTSFRSELAKEEAVHSNELLRKTEAYKLLLQMELDTLRQLQTLVRDFALHYSNCQRVFNNYTQNATDEHYMKLCKTFLDLREEAISINRFIVSNIVYLKVDLNDPFNKYNFEPVSTPLIELSEITQDHYDKSISLDDYLKRYSTLNNGIMSGYNSITGNIKLRLEEMVE